jgi:hypothetical protein
MERSCRCCVYICLLQMHSCGYCQQTFVKKSQLMEHHRLNKHHNTFTCGVCQKMFTRKENLDRHDSLCLLCFVFSFISPFVLCFPSVSNFYFTSQYHQFPLPPSTTSSSSGGTAATLALGPYSAIDPYVKPFFTPQLCSQP